MALHAGLALVLALLHGPGRCAVPLFGLAKDDLRGVRDGSDGVWVVWFRQCRLVRFQVYITGWDCGFFFYLIHADLSFFRPFLYLKVLLL
jgi:hypothetical protein